MTKSRYFWTIEIQNLWILEVEHDPNLIKTLTCPNFDPIAISRDRKLKMKHSKNREFDIIHQMSPKDMN